MSHIMADEDVIQIVYYYYFVMVQLCDLLHEGAVHHVQHPSVYTPIIVYLVTIKYSTFRMTNGVLEFNISLATHKLQLETGGMLELYWCSLYAMLSKQIFDTGELFSPAAPVDSVRENKWKRCK